MPNRQIEELIAERLRTGIVHPGDRGRGIAPTPIALPFGAKPGMPKEMADLMDGTVKLLAEAIVHTIEKDGDCEIVPRSEVRGLRRAVGDEPIRAMLPVHCHCDTTLSEPLMVLTVIDPEHITVDGPALITGLAKRKSTCPHEFST